MGDGGEAGVGLAPGRAAEDDNVWGPASVAGIAHGIVYNRSGKVTAVAIIRSLIDVVRGFCF